MWIESRLDQLADISSGGTPSRDVDEYWDGDIPWVTPTDITACRGNIVLETVDRITKKGLLNSSAKLLPQGTILLTSRATVGIPRIAGKAVTTNQGFKNLLPLPQVDGKFLFYQLQRQRGAFERYAAGSTFPEINKKDTARVLIPHPADKALQEKIASVLSCIDTAIEKTEALIAKHQQIKVGLMHDLFTRGVLPNGQLRPSRSEAPELYQETAIGWIPMDWRLVQAGDVCSLITKGTTPAAHDMWREGEGIRFLRVDNLTFDRHLDFMASTFRVSVDTHMGALARSRCLPGDVLTNIVGPPLGKVGLVTTETGEININQAIAVFRPRESLLSRFFLSWLTTDTVKRWFLQRAKQTSGQVNLTLGMCQSMPVPAMPLDEQGRILARIQSNECLIEAEKSLRQQLSEQKLGLMQDLLTGKVPVTVPPEHTEAAA